MPVFLNKSYIHTQNKDQGNNSGFSLIEILVALTLVGIVIYSVDFSLTGGSDDVESCISTFERASRFASHEAILRGTMVRIHLSLEKNPQEWVLEAAPDGDFILPLFEKYDDNSKLSLEDKAKKEKMIKDVNNKFSKISEFQDEVGTLPGRIKIVGVATSARSSMLVQDGEASIYFYPNGEKDAALMIFSGAAEVFSLTIGPFTDEMQRDFFTFDKKKSEDMLLDEMEAKAKEIYDKWLKN
ncbi:MAG: prepilin-type N-terminal cleavage/methylation domain-containing protein [Oligoflexia bacterium]|nr:prepilin-type N-terminal cleavage/methylation domain-containing protein [Oligoflexia bacterium]